ncbi:MAG: potassium-transporting ATPase subunit KdpC [Leptolyngbya sp.]|nr:potassium-transporting ATPase subunit KdpC [Candidatus Melainabacteria bacterium]
MSKIILQSVLMLTVMTLVTGVIYPCFCTALAQAFFSPQANGSLIKNEEGVVIGSDLLGQQFSSDKYFSSRPSATSPYPYNASGSGGSNLGPTNKALIERMKEKITSLKNARPESTALIPIDLVTTSASGLDPHISIESANYQIDRIAAVRNLPTPAIMGLIKQCSESSQFMILGEPRVNVLRLNYMLDRLK